MATRSAIVRKMRNGKFKGVYCHNDGYLDWNGKLLYENYKDEEKVKRLIDLGFISSLREEIDIPDGATHSFDNRADGITVAYIRDRNENKEHNKAITGTLSEVLDSIDHAYAYVFINGEWHTLIETVKDYEEFDIGNINQILTIENLEFVKLSEFEVLFKE